MSDVGCGRDPVRRVKEAGCGGWEASLKTEANVCAPRLGTLIRTLAVFLMAPPAVKCGVGQRKDVALVDSAPPPFQKKMPIKIITMRMRMMYLLN